MRNALPAVGALAALLPALAAQTSFPNLVYATYLQGTTPQNLLLDLQVPAGPGPFPLLVWIHGGGWQAGSRLPMPADITREVARGYAVASIDYRLSGTAIWPAQIQDCKAAIRFLRANAATWGIDGNRIGVMGSSAGGHLVAALATMGDVGEVHVGSYVVDLEGSVGSFLQTSSRVKAAVDLFGPTDMLYANEFPTFDHDDAASPESHLVGGALQQNPEKWASVDPISFVTPDDAPLLVLHGTDDTSVPFSMSQRLVDAARAIGNDVTFFQVQDNGHGGPGFSSPEARAAVDAFFDRTVGSVPATIVRVVTTDASANENGDTAAWQITRTGSTTAPLVVRVWPGGTATEGVDFARLPMLCTIPAGQSSTTLVLLPLQDALVEGDESVDLQLVPSAAYGIDPAANHAVVTIGDDDPAAGLPVINLVTIDVSASEGPIDPGAIRCQRTGSTANSLLVHYDVAGTATPGLDYSALAGTVLIPAGSAAALVIVHPLPDALPEASETVVLHLAAASNYAIGAQATAHVVIADDDRQAIPVPVVGVLATQQNLGEPAASGVFSLTRTGPTGTPLLVHFAISGTATAGTDYAALGTSATIPAGEAWVRLPITVLDDAVAEAPESIVLTILPDPTYAVGSVREQALWIRDDDGQAPPAAEVQLAVGPLSIGNEATATLVGGEPNGLGSVWIGLLPGYTATAFGIVQIDLAAAGPFATGTLGAAGSATFPLPIPASSALAGLATWWQAIATTPQAPFAALSPVQARRLGGTAAF